MARLPPQETVPTPGRNVIDPTEPDRPPMAEPAFEPPTAAGESAHPGDRVARAVWDWRAADAEGEAAERRRRAAAARREGLVRAAVGALVGALVWWWKPVLGTVVLAVTLTVLLLALASPLGAYRTLAAALRGFGHAVGLAVTWVLMTLIFYLLFFPAGWALRVLGRLGLTFGAERGRASYWEPVSWERVSAESYRRQF